MIGRVLLAALTMALVLLPLGGASAATTWDSLRARRRSVPAPAVS